MALNLHVENDTCFITKCIALKTKMAELIYLKKPNRSELQELINCFNFGLIASDSPLDRKLALVFGSLILNQIFKLPFSESLSILLRGPFLARGHLIFLSFEARDEQVYANLEKKTALVSKSNTVHANQDNILFHYVITSVKGDKMLNLGVSIERVYEMLTKPLLIECLPDPKTTHIYVNMRQCGKVVSKNIVIEHLNQEAWLRLFLKNHPSSKGSSPFLVGDPAFSGLSWGECLQIKEERESLNQASVVSMKDVHVAGTSVRVVDRQRKPKSSQNLEEENTAVHRSAVNTEGSCKSFRISRANSLARREKKTDVSRTRMQTSFDLGKATQGVPEAELASNPTNPPKPSFKVIAKLVIPWKATKTIESSDESSKSPIEAKTNTHMSTETRRKAFISKKSATIDQKVLSREHEPLDDIRIEQSLPVSSIELPTRSSNETSKRLTFFKVRSKGSN